MFWEIVSIISVVIGRFLIFGAIVRYIVEIAKNGRIPSNTEFAIIFSIMNATIFEAISISRTVEIVLLLILFFADIFLAKKVKELYDTDE